MLHYSGILSKRNLNLVLHTLRVTQSRNTLDDYALKNICGLTSGSYLLRSQNLI